jgi:hypothetical protein
MKTKKAIPTPEKNEWDLLLKLLPFLENNDKAILHILSEKKSLSDYKTWGVVRFKRTNYLAETHELEQILHILQDDYGRHVTYSSRNNQIYIRGAVQKVFVPEYHDDLPF